MPSPVYFPDSRVASRAESTSPVTQPDPMHGPDNIQLFQSPPDPPRQSAEQGMGRSPGQRWPHQTHVSQANYDQLSNMGWHPGEVVPVERYGWSAPLYYEQAVGSHHVWPVPIVINEAPGSPYTGLSGVGP